MNLKQSYEFLKLIVEGEIETWEARDRATGKRVLVHLLLVGDAAANKADAERISDLCKQNHELIAVGLDAEIPFVVTGTAFGSVGLREWSRVAEAAAMPTQIWRSPPRAGADNVPPVAAPQGEPAGPGMAGVTYGARPIAGAGEFTRMFQAPLRPAAKSDVNSPAAGVSPEQQAPIKKPAPTQNKKSEPGEFTRVFQSPQRGTPPAQNTGKTSDQVSPDQKAGGAVAPSGPGEFTRFFESPYGSQPSGKSPSNVARNPERSDDLFKLQPAPNPVPPGLVTRPSASPAGSEFTQMFQRSAAALPSDHEPGSSTEILRPPQEPPAPVRTVGIEPPPKPPVPPAPGDFTRIFSPAAKPPASPESPSIPDSPLKPAPRAEPPRLPPPFGNSPPPVSGSQPAMPQPAAEAGEYTRVMRPVQAPKIQPPAEAIPKETPALKAGAAKVKPPAATQFPVLAVLLGLLLLAVLVVIIFALRR